MVYAMALVALPTSSIASSRRRGRLHSWTRLATGIDLPLASASLARASEATSHGTEIPTSAPTGSVFEDGSFLTGGVGIALAFLAAASSVEPRLGSAAPGLSPANRSDPGAAQREDGGS